MMDGETLRPIIISGDNIILKGAGAQGVSNGGSTILQHKSPRNFNKMFRLFETGWKGNGYGSYTGVTGKHEIGSKSFTVANASSLINRKVVRVTAWSIKPDNGNDFGASNFSNMSSVPITRYGSNWETKQKGIQVLDYYEIDRIEGNTVHIKTPLQIPLNPGFVVCYKDVWENIGFEDLHIDGNLQETYQHHGNLGHYGFGGITLKNTIHSWIRRCRFSNTVNALGFNQGLHNTAIHIIVDGKHGHFPAQIVQASHNLIAYLEDKSDTGMWHGVGVQKPQTGNVYYKISGTTLKGPDCHGSCPKNTLFDNHFSTSHYAGGGIASHKPRHLNGFIRWNNTVTHGGQIDYWGIAITQAILVGYKTSGDESPNAYNESHNSHMNPKSLYVAQIEKRIGNVPIWLTDANQTHQKFYTEVYTGVSTRDKLLSDKLVTE